MGRGGWLTAFQVQIDTLVMKQSPRAMFLNPTSPPQWGVWLGRRIHRWMSCACFQDQIDILAMIHRPQVTYSISTSPPQWGVGWVGGGRGG
jgi:hypothetical protein